MFPTPVAMTFDGISPDLFANIFLGDLVDITDPGGSKADEQVTARLDKWAQLGTSGGGISNVVVKDSGGSTTYAVDTDYVLDTRAGLIKAVSTGAITDGEILSVSYDYAALSGSKIIGATQPLVNVAILFSGKNVFDGSPADVRIFKASLRPASAVDFLSEEPQELQFDGKMITPAGKSWPFELS